jgi:hypothetical protein
MIVHRLKAEGIEIVSALYAKRDIRSILGEREGL